MHVNHTPDDTLDDPPRKPCIRDFHELLHQHLPPALILKVTPILELERRLDEIVLEHPHLREEAPLVLVGESRRRDRLSGQLKVTVNQRYPLQLHA